jgi:hypothetical protein
MTPRFIPSSVSPLSQWGLPEDYAALTVDGQRLARVNACLQYTSGALHPHQRADAFTRAVHFFDAWYLTPEVAADGEVVFDPYFYEGPWLPAPPLHDLFHRALISQKFSAGVGPRGFAKTYSISKESLLLMLTQPAFRISYATSTNDLTETFGGRQKHQIEFNKRLNDDFGPLWGGALKSARGSGAWGMTHFDLTNRSGLFCTSAESRQRGMRPMVYYLDDPEYDPKQSTSMELVRQNAEILIFRIAMPMVIRARARMSWRGTFVSKQHLLWHALQVRTDEHGNEVPATPEFGEWYRIIVPLLLDNPDGTQRSAWPHNFPVDAAERAALGLDAETLTIPEIRKRLGEAVFQAEMLANPGDSGIAYFGGMSEELHGWWLEDVDSLASPLQSTGFLCFRRLGAPVRVALRNLHREGFRIYCVGDTAYTDTATSDYKAVGVFAVSPYGEVFVLDLHAGKEPTPMFAATTLRMAAKWQASAIYSEKVRGGSVFLDTLRTHIRDSLIPGREMLSHVPSVIGYPTGLADKGSRIAGNLTVRFEQGLIKMPLRWAGRPPWSLLFEQVRGFNPYARNCGLANDDCINILGDACSPDILRGIPSMPFKPSAPTPLHALMQRGELINPKTGEPYLMDALPSMTREDFAATLASVFNRPQEQRPRSIIL